MPSLYISNLFDVLLYKLEKNLFEEKAFFRKLIILPSDLLKEVLYKKWSKEQGVNTGFKVLKLPAAIDYLMRLVRFQHGKTPHFSAPMLLSLHLEALLQERLQDNEERDLFQPIFDYLQGDLFQKKLQGLCDELSSEFLHYGLYGGKGLKLFCEKRSWQQSLWETVMRVWDAPQLFFEEKRFDNSLNFKIDIHLFGFTTLPRLYEKFFCQLGESFRLHYYFLNPSQVFWGDRCEGESSLLANFGNLSRKRLNHYLDREELKLQEYFLDPVTFQPIRGDKGTFLQEIKRDLLYGREEEAVLSFFKKDHSLQFHEAPSKKREVEALLGALLDLTHRFSILPSDILVLIPEISLYYPFIHEVFGAQDFLPFEILDLPFVSQSELLQGLWHLFCLGDLKWEVADLLKFFTLQPFLQKLGFSKEEAKQVLFFCERAHIKWGYEKKHRNRWIQKTARDQEVQEASEAGTWKYGLERLLLGLVVTEDAENTRRQAVEYFPLEGIEMTEAITLGKVMQVIEDLYQEMLTLDAAIWSLDVWIEHLQGLIEKFFCWKSLPKEESMAEFFLEQLKMLHQLSVRNPKATYGFSSIKRFFKKAFEKKGAKVSQANKEVVRFSSLEASAFYGVKVIALLGLDEEVFPRAVPPRPLRAIEEDFMEEKPSPIEEDRQAILNTFLYAEEAVIVSYCNRDAQDGKIKASSFLVEELLELLDKNYSIEGDRPSQKLRTVHKPVSFHKYYFSKEAPYINFSWRDYGLAKHYYHKLAQPHTLIPEFYKETGLKLGYKEVPLEEMVSLQELKTFARNPLQSFFNKSLGVYLEKEKQTPLEKEFTLTARDKALLKKDSLHKGLDTIYEKKELLGHLPLGVFKEIAKEELEDQDEEMGDKLEAVGLTKEDLFTLELSLSCDRIYKKSAKYWVVPCLKVPLQETTFILYGVLEPVSKLGLISQGKASFQEFIKIWPLYLTFCCTLYQHEVAEIKTDIIFLKEGITKNFSQDFALSQLKLYLEYYQKAHHVPSPLFPEWAEAFLLKPLQEFQSAMKKSFFGPKDFIDDYQKWMLLCMEPFSAEALEGLWKKELSKLFEPLQRLYGEENA